MKIYLAGFKILENKLAKEDYKDTLILSSFFEHKNGKYGDYVLHDKHILDSGAFSFLRGKKADWDLYVDKYCSFIEKTKQKYFFELDIDSIIGLNKVEIIRDKIEQRIGMQSIPVWHKSRGIDYWYKLVEEYDYVAIGGLVSAGVSGKEYKYLQMMVDYANKRGTKVHGLGFTKMEWLKKIKWHSVDSTTWLNAGRFGEYQWFDGTKIKKRTATGIGMKVKQDKVNEMLIHNFKEWNKFQKYADENL